MQLTELIIEINEYLSNLEWKSIHFNERIIPENTRIEPGFVQNKVVLQGLNNNYPDLKKAIETVLSWTNIPVEILSIEDIYNHITNIKIISDNNIIQDYDFYTNLYYIIKSPFNGTIWVGYIYYTGTLESCTHKINTLKPNSEENPVFSLIPCNEWHQEFKRR